MIHLIYIGVAATLFNMILAIADGNHHAALGWFSAFAFGLAVAVRIGDSR